MGRDDGGDLLGVGLGIVGVHEFGELVGAARDLDNLRGARRQQVVYAAVNAVMRGVRRGGFDGPQ